MGLHAAIKNPLKRMRRKDMFYGKIVKIYHYVKNNSKENYVQDTDYVIIFVK